MAPDQLLDMDFLTEYPIVDDSDLKRPMLYYCHAGQWLHISRAITKPYKRALEAIDILDDDLRACRLQITWFEDAYFNPAPVSLLEDQRRGRIPLLNFFRYYACWLFIAKRSKVKQFSTLTVRDGFSILIESATSQYVTILGYVGKRLLNAVDTSDRIQIFSGIAMIQHLVSVPVSVLDESKRGSIADLIEGSAQIESEIERRIATEFPSSISALMKAIKNFPSWDTGEIPMTLEWRGVSRIETAYPEIVADYEKASRVFQSLKGLTLGEKGSDYLVSSNKNFEAAFNAVVARDVVAQITMAEANAPEESATGFLFPLNITGWETNAVLPVLRELIVAAPFHASLSNQIALVHLFLPFYVADLQTSHSGLVRLEFVKAARVLGSCLAALPDFNVEQLRSLIIRCETTWQDWSIPIGIAYSILDNAGKDLLLGSTHDAVRLLTVHCGDRREKMHDYVGRSRLHQLYADSAKVLKAIARNEFAREHYEKYGFLPTERAIRPLFEKPHDDTTAIVQPSQVDDEWKHGSKEYIVGKSITKSWDDDHKHDYDELRKDQKRWESAISVVKREVEAMWTRLEGGEAINLTDEIANLGLTRDVKGVLISRWIQIGLEANETDRDHRMGVLGWTVERNANWSDPVKRWNAYYNYFHGCGFMINKNGLILPKSLLWPEERDWYLKHRKNK